MPCSCFSARVQAWQALRDCMLQILDKDLQMRRWGPSSDDAALSSSSPRQATPTALAKSKLARLWSAPMPPKPTCPTWTGPVSQKVRVGHEKSRREKKRLCQPARKAACTAEGFPD
eukprot:1152301-Pelagomonas_calceolata.AAC.1